MTQCQGAGGIGTRYTYAQLEGIWINNGGNKAMAPLMAAVAEVESGGCSTAYNASGATGLWQIEWPLHEGIVPGATSRQALFNPNTNAKAAIRLSGNVNSVAPGSPVYDNWLEDEPPGAYKQFLKNSTTPDTNVPGGSTGGGTTATLTAASSPGCLLGIPSVDLKVTSIGGGCIVSKSEGRAVIGALVMMSGGVILGVGALVLVAIGLKHAGAGKVAGRALEVGGAAAAVAGVPEAGVPLAAAGARVRRQGTSRAATSAAVSRARRQVAAKRAPAPRRKASSPSQQPALQPA